MNSDNFIIFTLKFCKNHSFWLDRKDTWIGGDYDDDDGGGGGGYDDYDEIDDDNLYNDVWWGKSSNKTIIYSIYCFISHIVQVFVRRLYNS